MSSFDFGYDLFDFIVAVYEKIIIVDGTLFICASIDRSIFILIHFLLNEFIAAAS